MTDTVFEGIGGPVLGIDTPALLVDAEAVQRNIERMAAFGRGRLRPTRNEAFPGVNAWADQKLVLDGSCERHQAASPRGHRSEAIEMGVRNNSRRVTDL